MLKYYGPTFKEKVQIAEGLHSNQEENIGRGRATDLPGEKGTSNQSLKIRRWSTSHGKLIENIGGIPQGSKEVEAKPRLLAITKSWHLDNLHLRKMNKLVHEIPSPLSLNLSARGSTLWLGNNKWNAHLKKKSKNDPGNYKPTSLTSTVKGN